ncbi:hypothetical protein M5D96_009057, partial [Drosophila gunungcola]
MRAISPHKMNAATRGGGGIWMPDWMSSRNPGRNRNRSRNCGRPQFHVCLAVNTFNMNG